jgi:putative Mg2+ transporter-C (MgtC) family protein
MGRDSSPLKHANESQRCKGIAEHLNWGALSFGGLMLRLGLATALGLLVGIEREWLERAAGMRSHAVVCLDAALITVVTIYGFPAPGGDRSVSIDPRRIAAQT